LTLRWSRHLLGCAQQRQAIFDGFGRRDDWAAEALQWGLQARLALR